jgi:hypothetical protein
MTDPAPYLGAAVKQGVTVCVVLDDGRDEDEDRHR